MKGSHCTHPAGTCPTTHLHLRSALVQWLESPRGATPAGPCSHRAGQHHSPLQPPEGWKSGNHCPEQGVQIDTPEQRPRTAAAHVSLSPKTVSRTRYRSAHLRVKSIAKIKIRIKGINVTSCVSITGLLKEAVRTISAQTRKAEGDKSCRQQPRKGEVFDKHFCSAFGRQKPNNTACYKIKYNHNKTLSILRGLQKDVKQ